MLANIMLAIFGYFLVSNLIFFWIYRETFVRLWQEPVLKRPIVIFESDDWGVGPPSHAEALQQIIAVLTKYQDRDGRHPVMTLGMTLALLRKSAQPGAETEFVTRTLDEQEYQPIRDAIKEGIKQGVLSPQLHGMEHYWPSDLLTAANIRQDVKDWFDDDESITEDLPSELQSRWVNSTHLPSSSHAESEIYEAVLNEVNAYTEIFLEKPRVVVPPTFVWSDEVERAWVAAGIELLITPGRRLVRRGLAGEYIADKNIICNGQKSASGLGYMVRNDYFEPAMGHRAIDGLQALVEKVSCFRPALFEIHRFNFVRDTQGTANSLEQLDQLIKAVVERCPDTLFMSTQQLWQALADTNEVLFDNSFGVRLMALVERVQRVYPLWSYSRLTGLRYSILLYQKILNITHKYRVKNIA